MRRNRTHTPASVTPKLLLGTRWKLLGRDELALYLRRLIVAERKCLGGEFSKRVAPRLRWRRLATAHRLVAIGRIVDRRVFLSPNARSWSSGELRPKVPPRYSWVGVFTLVPVQGKTDED